MHAHTEVPPVRFWARAPVPVGAPAAIALLEALRADAPEPPLGHQEGVLVPEKPEPPTDNIFGIDLHTFCDGGCCCKVVCDGFEKNNQERTLSLGFMAMPFRDSNQRKGAESQEKERTFVQRIAPNRGSLIFKKHPAVPRRSVSPCICLKPCILIEKKQ